MENIKNVIVVSQITIESRDKSKHSLNVRVARAPFRVVTTKRDWRMWWWQRRHRRPRPAELAGPQRVAVAGASVFESVVCVTAVAFGPRLLVNSRRLDTCVVAERARACVNISCADFIVFRILFTANAHSVDLL